MSSEGVAALLLAAGGSRRMRGANKLVCDLAGRPVVAWAAAALQASAARPIVVVTGHQAERIGEALAGQEVELVENPDWRAGMATSIRAGLGVLGSAVSGAVIALGDMPRLRGEHVDQLIAAFAAAGRRAICVPRCGGRRGNPVLWPAHTFAALAALRGDVGGRALLEGRGGEIVYVDIADPAIHADVDSPEDLRALAARATPT